MRPGLEVLIIADGGNRTRTGQVQARGLPRMSRARRRKLMAAKRSMTRAIQRAPVMVKKNHSPVAGCCRAIEDFRNTPPCAR